MPPWIVPRLRTGSNPSILRALLSSTKYTPCLFLGRFSFESRVICGKHWERAANIECGPLRATSRAVPSYGTSRSVATVTISAKARAICQMLSSGKISKLHLCHFATQRRFISTLPACLHRTLWGEPSLRVNPTPTDLCKKKCKKGQIQESANYYYWSEVGTRWYIPGNSEMARNGVDFAGRCGPAELRAGAPG